MELKIEHQTLENCQFQLNIEIPSKELKNEYEIVKKEFLKQAHLPGFRKGKVPVNIVDKKFKNHIRERVLKNILPKAFQKAVDEKKLKTFGQPKIEEVTDYEDDKPLKVEFKVDKEPSVEIGKNEEIEITEDNITIDDIDIQEEIDSVTRSKATIEDKSTPVKENDHLKINISVDGEENASLNLKNHPIHFKPLNPIPYDLFEDIKNLEKNQKKKIKKSYSKEHQDERLRGKTLDFEIEVLEIKELKPPDLTESIAKELGYDSVENLKNRCKSNLENFITSHKKTSKYNALMDALIKKSNFQIPSSLMEFNVNRYIDNLKAQFANKEQMFQSYLTMQNKTINDIREQFEKQVQLDIKRELILMKIKSDYKIEVKEDEIIQRIQKIADFEKKDVKQLRKEIIKSGEYTRLKDDICIEKGMDFILEKVKIKKGRNLSVNQLLIEKQNNLEKH